MKEQSIGVKEALVLAKEKSIQDYDDKLLQEMQEKILEYEKEKVFFLLSWF